MMSEREVEAAPIEELPRDSRAEADRLVDSCMRPGEELSMTLDFPLLLGPEARARRLVRRAGGRIVAHAAARVLRCRTPAGRSFGLLDVGAVCTHPEHRGRGHARRLVEELLREARLAGIEAAILWAEVEGFYEKMGFRSAGLETRFLVAAEPLARAPAADVWPLRQSDLREVAALRNAEAFPIERSLDEARALFAIPRCTTRVAFEDGRPVAYASLGKGLDFQGVVSEWGGRAELLPALVRELMMAQDLEQAMVIGPAWNRAYRSAFELLGFAAEDCDMAMMRVLDPRRLVLALQPHFAEPLPTEAEALCERVFGRTGPSSPAKVLPFYVWGLDSV